MSKSGLDRFSLRGSVAEIDKKWKSWLRSFQYYVKGEGISDKDKLFNLLLHTAGPEVQEIFDDLADPNDDLLDTDPNKVKPNADDDYQKALRKLNSYFTHSSNPTFERHIFRQLTPQQGESGTQFATRLRHQGNLCEFGTQLDDHIRDQLVATVRDATLQRQLLSESKLTLSKTLEMFRIFETSSSQSSEMTSATPAAVMKVQSYSANAKPSKPCSRCNLKGHNAKDTKCPAREKTCLKCKNKGHFAVCCKTKVTESKPTKFSSTKQVKVDDSAQSDGAMEAAAVSAEYQFSMSEIKSVSRVSNAAHPPVTVSFLIEGKPLEMEVDTGADVTLIPLSVWERSWKDVPMKSTPADLCTFSGEALHVMGEAAINAQYRDQRFHANIFIVREGNNALLGRNWLSFVKLDWRNLFQQVNSISTRDSMSQEFQSVFSNGLGHVRGFEAEIHVKDGAKPKCFPPRSLPYSLKAKVDMELDRLQKEGVITPVEHAEWASPIVVVRKKNGSIRLCGDFKVSINPHIESHEYPIPNPSDLLSSISGASVFSKLDLSQAYNQLPLSAESQKYCVISTHRGLFACTRLPFGVASAPSIWQRTIERVLQGLDGVLVYFDDLLIYGADQAEHDRRLRMVLKRFEEAGLKLSKEKCEIDTDEVKYLGYRVTSSGLHPDEDKVEAIRNASPPTDVQSVQSFLGLVNFYSRFVPSCSEVLHPLNRLLQKDVPFDWTKQCQQSFDSIKAILADSPVLLHYDATKPAVVECDASPYGLGACLLQPGPKGQLQPVYYVSRSLTAPEKNYSQIDKEALAIVFGVKRLHQYLYGRHFILRTDHKPLLKIFGENQHLSAVTAARLQRWAVTLSSYSYTIEYIKGPDNVVADCLSRLPLPMTPAQEKATIQAITESSSDPCQDLPIMASDVAKATADDPTLCKVSYFIQHGWPTAMNDEFKPYFKIRDELSIDHGVILWKNRVVIAPVFRRLLLNELHQDHLGISKMKAVARSFFWWPKLDSDISDVVSTCTVCQQSSRAPVKEETHHWIYPSRPLERVHIDFAEYQGAHYLLAIDAYSKWPDVFPMGNNTTTARTIECMAAFIAERGIPSTIVSDNGPQFTSAEFAKFCSYNGITHKKTPPYHPASNGQIERVVQELKKFLRHIKNPKLAVSRFLYTYRNTPHSTTNVPPAQLILKYTPTTRFTLLQPQFSSAMRSKQDTPVAASREFKEGDRVLILNARDPSSSQKWIPGIVIERLGPLTYTVLSNERQRKVHIEHLRSHTPAPDTSSTNLPMKTPLLLPVSTPNQSSNVSAESTSQTDAPGQTVEVNSQPVLRRSARANKGVGPDRYEPSS